MARKYSDQWDVRGQPRTVQRARYNGRLLGHGDTVVDVNGKAWAFQWVSEGLLAVRRSADDGIWYSPPASFPGVDIVERRA